MSLVHRALLGALVLGLSVGVAHAQNVLLVPDSLNDRVLALNPLDGSVINANFISDATLLTPIQAIDSGRGTIFVSDQVLNSVREYSLSGAFLGTVIDSTRGISNIRGIAVRNGSLFIAVGGGTLTGTVQQFDLTTTALTTFANLNPVTASASPWGILFRDNDVLVSDSQGDDILRFGLNGTFLSKYYDSPGSGDLNFPQQITARRNGNLLVGGFSVPAGLYEFTGALAGIAVSGSPLKPGFGVRAGYELGNGEYLYTAGTLLGRINPTTNLDTTILSSTNSTSFRFISPLTLGVATPEPGVLGLMGLGMTLGAVGWLRGRNSTGRL